MKILISENAPPFGMYKFHMRIQVRNWGTIIFQESLAMHAIVFYLRLPKYDIYAEACECGTGDGRTSSERG